MKAVTREEVIEIHEGYNEIFITESHTHPMFVDRHDVLRWIPNPTVVKCQANLNLNDLTNLLIAMGYGKESHIYRQLYRDMGVSLSMYMDVFY